LATPRKPRYCVLCPLNASLVQASSTSCTTSSSPSDLFLLLAQSSLCVSSDPPSPHRPPFFPCARPCPHQGTPPLTDKRLFGSILDARFLRNHLLLSTSSLLFTTTKMKGELPFLSSLGPLLPHAARCRMLTLLFCQLLFSSVVLAPAFGPSYVIVYRAEDMPRRPAPSPFKVPRDD
jgi:hypothetical protein